MYTLARPAIGLAVAGFALSSLAGCSSGSTSSDASTSAAATSPAATSPAATDSASAPTESAVSESATASGSGPACDKTAIAAALPEGSTVVKYTCDEAGVEYWAAAEVQEGPTVFFLKWTGDTWDAMDSDAVCGTASAGLPEDILAYCADAS